MCGRFVCFDVDEISKKYGVKVDMTPLYNVSPGQKFPVIFKKDTIKAEFMVWGLIPHWMKEITGRTKMINARAETISEKPYFKSSLKSRRCLIPANGFYEWKKTEDRKIPYFISLKGKTLFSFAGLYDIWIDYKGEEFKTFTIITGEANSLISDIHNRMPVILPDNDERLWLDNSITDTDKLTDILKPFPSQDMDAYIVSNLVNNVRNDFKDLINPLS